MDHSNQLTSPRTPVHITDEEHTLILMLRTMPLDEIIYVMMLNNFLPIELPRKYDHIANIINLHFKKSYEVHKIPLYFKILMHYNALQGNNVFDQNLLIDFEQQLIQNNVSFEGYTSAYNSKIQLIEKRQNQKSTTATDSITLLDERYFQMTWLLINVVKFLFMTTNQKVSNIPMSVRDVDECNDYFSKIQLELYKNFVGFWTQHQRFTKRCNPTTCSKVFIVDGHQKANRLVCQYKDVFDNSIYELGPVQMGCLHSPLRKVRRVLHHILTILRFGQLPNAMCYDCACTLKLFINRHFGSNELKSTDSTQFLTSLAMAIDRFHVKNHKRPMCKTVMRPDHPCHNDIYASINTQVAEQGFSYLSKFKNSFRGYSYPKSTIFFTVLFHLKNCTTTGISSFEQAV
ncbi:unnamed protein product [Rotaria socialis]|uniref:Uncharacterized protein n=2 Tax=Rotaria socialis TaxID=392032 RepID=A0A820VM51_9BILA|nr:unnamed protein product [Rotaria socialis]